MHPRRLVLPHLLSAISYLLLAAVPAAPFSTNANRLAYLDEDNPFYPHRDFPKLITPQWVGEPGVEAVVILAIDDMRDSKKYETFLRPILERLKKMDGRAPVSIFANVVEPSDPQLQTWLKEGLSLEVHTLAHPCPLLQKGSFTNAWNTYHGGVDLLSKVPGNKPVAFRMPCCDSMNSPSPRFYAEIFNRTSPDGNFLHADSSVMCLLTDNFLKRHGVTPPQVGQRVSPDSPSKAPAQAASSSQKDRRDALSYTDHFRRYFPATTNALTKKSLANFGTYLEDYPYPYVINRTCWEFPAMVPSDWEAFNAHGPTNAATVADWQFALDAVVRAQGVFTFIFHPHGWIRADQVIQFIDHAERTHGKKVKFLTFKEAVERLNKNLLNGVPLRAEPHPLWPKHFSVDYTVVGDPKNPRYPIRLVHAGNENGVRVLDANNDGFLDVVIGSPMKPFARQWDLATLRWSDISFRGRLAGYALTQDKWGILHQDGFAASIHTRNEVDSVPTPLLRFDGAAWQADERSFTRAKEPELQYLAASRRLLAGYCLRDFDRDGRCELLVSNDKQNALFAWSDTERTWKKLPHALPPGLALVNERGEDNGLRFVDLNGDGFDDLLLSNEKEYAIYLWARDVKPNLGWHAGWSHKVLHEQRPKVGQASSLSSNSPAPAPAVGTPIPHPPSPIPSPKEIPPFVRSGPHRNNGAWFHRNQLFVQNEDTAHLPDVVWRKSFSELIAFDMPAPKTPAESQQCFQVRPGFRVELVAAEPLVMSPVAFEWAADGKLWVVEMGDYPNGVPEHEARASSPSPLVGRGERAGVRGGGKVKFLEDLDGDGTYDKATVFLDNLPFPTGVMPWRKGVLISAAPDILYAEDTDGDGKADVRKVLFTGFREGNQQHRVNGFELGLDNWIYGANGDSGGTITFVSTTAPQVGQRVPPDPQTKDPAQADSPNQKDRRDALSYSGPPRSPVSISGRDFRFRPDTGEFEAIEGQTQFGRRRDDWGNWFGNNNPNWLWHYWLPDRYLRRNPHLAVKSSRQMLANYPDSTRCYPISTPPIRFNQPQSVNHVTSGCSPAPYRDDLFGPGFATSVFISEPVHNLVHREVLEPDGVSFTSRRAPDEQDREFLASTDNWFRPTMLKTGPDGALYIADFYRFVLEHPEWIAPETQARLDLRAGADKGRIWRVVPENQPLRKIPNLAKLNTTQLVAALDSPSGWQRDTVQRLLVERKDRWAVKPLENLVSKATNPKVRLQTLCTLEGLNELTYPVLRAGISDTNSLVCAETLRAAESFYNPNRRRAAAQADDQPAGLQIMMMGDPWPALVSAWELRQATATMSNALSRETRVVARAAGIGFVADLADVVARGGAIVGDMAKRGGDISAAISEQAWQLETAKDSLSKRAHHTNEVRLAFQWAMSVGEPAFGIGDLGKAAWLAGVHYSRRGFREAVLSSAATGVTAFSKAVMFMQSLGADYPRELMEDTLTLLGAMGQEADFARVLSSVCYKQNSGEAYMGWEFKGIGLFLDAAERRNLPIARLMSSDSDMGKRMTAKVTEAISEARSFLRNPSTNQQHEFQASAITLLGREPRERLQDVELLRLLCRPTQRADVQQAAVAQLAKLGGSDSATALLADWKAHSPALREAVLSALLSRPAWIDTLLAALERGQVAPTQISPAQRQKLTTHPQAALRDRATKLFAATSADRAKVIKDYAVVATLTGSETRGRELFTKNCGVCHKLKGEGREIGPDLAMTTTRDTDWLLTAILDPNAAVEARYLGYTAETKSGREFTGIITAETPNNLVMRGADGTEETILRTDLKQLLGSGLSLMPEGMESALKPQDMADLLAFIRAK